LARRGHTLRHEVSDDGCEPAWILELGSTQKSSLGRREIRVDGGPAAPPQKLADAVIAIVGDREPMPVAVFQIDRQQYWIEDAAGRGLLVVDDDRVSLVDGGSQVGSFREIELGVIGDIDAQPALSVAVKRLRRAEAGAPDPTTKLERALGRSAAREETPSLGPDSTTEEVVRVALSEGLDQLLAHDPGIRLDLSEHDLHQARVATRRMRAHLRTLRPLLDRAVVDPLRQEIGWAGLELGKVRDLDVLCRTFVADLENWTDAERKCVVEAIELERSAAHLHLLDVMRSDRWRSIVHSLEVAARIPPLRGTCAPTARARPVARKLLEKSWRRLERRVVAARESDTGWHEVRKAAKSTRYAAELFEPLIGPGAAKLATAGEAIQTVLGEAQDSVVARSWLRGHGFDGDPAPGPQRVEDERQTTTEPEDWDALWRKARRAAARVC
jgi:CHAD domain-containing protein